MCRREGNMMSNFCGNIDTSVPKTAEVTRVHYTISAEVALKQLFSRGSSAEVTPVFAEVSYGSKLPYPICTLLPWFRKVSAWAWMVCGSIKKGGSNEWL